MLPFDETGKHKLKTNFQENNTLGATIFYEGLLTFTIKTSPERTPKPYIHGVLYLAYLKDDKKTEESIRVSFGTKPPAVK